jgi:hypothetical protein
MGLFSQLARFWFKRAIFDRAFLGIPSLHRERAGL